MLPLAGLGSVPVAFIFPSAFIAPFEGGPTDKLRGLPLLQGPGLRWSPVRGGGCDRRQRLLPGPWGGEGCVLRGVRGDAGLSVPLPAFIPFLRPAGSVFRTQREGGMQGIPEASLSPFLHAFLPPAPLQPPDTDPSPSATASRLPGVRAPGHRSGSGAKRASKALGL